MPKDDLTPFPKQVIERLQERLEKRYFTYLPAREWMLRGQYNQILLGDFRLGPAEAAFYRLLFLSQSTICLFYKADKLCQARHIDSDEQLVCALLEADFPVPA